MQRKVDVMIVFEKDVIIRVHVFDDLCSRLIPLFEKQYPNNRIQWFKKMKVESES